MPDLGVISFFFFKQKTAYEIGLGIPAEPLFRSFDNGQKQPYGRQHTYHHYRTQRPAYEKTDRKSGSAGMPRPISYAVFCLKKKKSKIPWPTTPDGPGDTTDTVLEAMLNPLRLSTPLDGTRT